MFLCMVPEYYSMLSIPCSFEWLTGGGGQFYQQLSYYAYDLRIYTTYTGIRNIFVIFPIHYCYKQYGFMIYLRDERNIFVSGYRAVGVGEGIRTAHHDQMKPLICLSSRCGGVGRVE